MDKNIFIINIFSFFPLLLLLFGASPILPIKTINRDYLSLESTKSLRGICAISILFHHMFQQGYLEDAGMFSWYETNGYLFVTIFFFLSGYGLMKQHMASENYKKKFLLKRLPAIVLPFLLALGVYLLIESTFGTVYEFSFIIRHTFLTGNIDPFVPYAWYIIVILVFYIVFALLMQIFRNHYRLMLLGGLVWFVCHVLLCKKLGYGGWWYITSFVLVIGMFFAAFEKEILSVMETKYLIIAPIIWLITIALFIYKHFKGAALAETHPTLEVISTAVGASLFAVSVVLAIMKIKIGNKMSAFLGEISLEIYLFQALWVKYLRSDLFRRFEGIYDYFRNPLIWSILVIVLTIVTAYLIHLLMKFILKYYRKLIKA